MACSYCKKKGHTKATCSKLKVDNIKKIQKNGLTIPKLTSIDFHYTSCLEYDYDTTACTGECDNYCRCSKIINAEVTEVNCTEIAQEIIEEIEKHNKIKLNEIDKYAVERLCISHHLWDGDNFYVSTDPGYYGEEIGGIFLEGTTKLEEDLKTVLDLPTLKQKVEFLLNIEYGYILDELEDCSYFFKTIGKSSISIGNDSYRKKVDHTLYEDYEGVFGIVLEKNHTFRLIDGFHRVLSTKEDNLRVLVATPIEE